jgi:transcriptional regulator with XRE-family HTH domain
MAPMNEDLATKLYARFAAASVRGRGPFIAAWRQAVGLRQADLAAAIGVSRVTVAYWESGRTPTERHLRALFRTLADAMDGTPSDELVTVGV